jgi:hypothetical protein
MPLSPAPRRPAPRRSRSFALQFLLHKRNDLLCQGSRIAGIFRSPPQDLSYTSRGVPVTGIHYRPVLPDDARRPRYRMSPGRCARLRPRKPCPGGSGPTDRSVGPNRRSPRAQYLAGPRVTMTDDPRLSVTVRLHESHGPGRRRARRFLAGNAAVLGLNRTPARPVQQTDRSLCWSPAGRSDRTRPAPGAGCAAWGGASEEVACGEKDDEHRRGQGRYCPVSPGPAPASRPPRNPAVSTPATLAPRRPQRLRSRTPAVARRPRPGPPCT